jgi:Protein of unknown function (DUF1593)
MANPRVIISSDLGGNDKDDAQSLIHAMLYANDLDYRGFVITRTDDGGRGGIGNGVSIAHEIVDAYERDLPNLRQTDADYPSAASLKNAIVNGATDPEWPGGVSKGAQLIIEEARAASPGDPLYVLTWGPIHDAARALHAAPDIVDNVRILAIAGRAQDKAHQDAYDWLIDAVKTDPRYEKLWMVDSAETFRGSHVNRNGAKNPEQYLDWVEENVDGHGALGTLFRDEFTDNLYGGRSPSGLKMGDTPSLLYLIDNAGDDNPAASSWGGSFRKSGVGPNMWTDKTDASLRMGEFDGARTVYDKRDAYMRDFAERLDAAAGRGGSSPDPEPDDSGGEPPRPDGGKPVGEGGEAAIGLGRTEAEDLDLDGYAADAMTAASGNAVVKANGEGRAAGVFDGPAGEYELTVGYLNETDGAARWNVLIDGKTVDSWTGAGGSGAFDEASTAVKLAPGDAIVIEGRREGGEHARVDYLDVQPVEGGPAAPDDGAKAPGVPVETAGVIGVGLTEMEDLDLDGYAAVRKSSASDGSWIETDGKGTASGRFDGRDGAYEVDVFYFNEDDGASAWRMEVDGTTVASWDGRGGRDRMETVSFEADLDRGDTIVLVGERGANEHARLDALMIAPADDWLS